MDRDLRTKACLMEQKHYAKHFRKKIYTSQIKRRVTNDSLKIQAFFIFIFNFARFLDKSCFGT